MPFWREDTEEEKKAKAYRASQKADQEESVRRLENGGLPLQATRRLTEQAASGDKFFSCTLSPKEYLLCREAGYQPIGQVMGSSFMRVAFNYFQGSFASFNTTGELQDLTNAHRESRILAVQRLREEAKLLGADGVIGVHIKTTRFSWSQGVSEFTAVGTAIKMPDREMLKSIKNLPFTSSLSGQEFWQLYEGGYWPCGVVMGNCSYLTCGDWQTRTQLYGPISSQSNQELKQFSDGFSWARHIATDRLHFEVGIEGGDGAVDMDIDYTMHRIHYEGNQQRYINFLVNFMAMGTAVMRRPDGKRRVVHQPLLIMDLAGRSKRELEFDVSMENLAESGFSDKEALE